MLSTRYFFMDEFTQFIPALRKYKCKEVHFAKGEYIKPPCRKLRYNYLFLDGLCRLSVLHDTGSERIIGFWGHGSMYPIIANTQEFFLEDSILVKAVTPVRALRFDVDTTRTIMREIPDVSVAMIDHYGKYGNLYMYYLTTVAFDPLKTRLCGILSIYHTNFNATDIPLNQNDLASLVGAKRESVVKIIRELKSEGIIQTCNGKTKILSLEKLEQYQSSLNT